VPWIAVAAQIGYSESQTGDVPTFVYGIFFSLFVAFNSFAVNMWLHYKGVGPWKRVEFTESGYLVLSLTAKTLLAWQVFFPTLMD
jgi:Heliorhodopsin